MHSHELERSSRLLQAHSSFIGRAINSPLRRPPPVPAYLIRTSIHLFNLVLLLLASDSPPPLAPALLPYPDLTSAVFILYPSVVVSLDCQVSPFHNDSQAIDEEKTKDSSEDGDKSGEECDSRHLTSQATRPELKALGSDSAYALVSEWCKKRKGFI
jgi:hypothetical protein